MLGIPVTVKESYNIAGLPTTWGMPLQRNYVPAEDAVQVSRLQAAGAVLLGKTNVPLMLRDFQSFNEIYGMTNNPWDHGRTSGGSSGGSAAAPAAGFGALSIGSDVSVEDEVRMTNDEPVAQSAVDDVDPVTSSIDGGKAGEDVGAGGGGVVEQGQE